MGDFEIRLYAALEWKRKIILGIYARCNKLELINLDDIQAHLSFNFQFSYGWRQQKRLFLISNIAFWECGSANEAAKDTKYFASFRKRALIWLFSTVKRSLWGKIMHLMEIKNQFLFWKVSGYIFCACSVD